MHKTYPAIQRLLQQGAQGVFPGAVLRVAVNGQVVVHEAVGRLSHDPTAANTTIHTPYDIASLTKPIVVGTLAMLAHDDGELSLDEMVSLPDPTSHGITNTGLTIRSILAHASGLPAWLPLGHRLWEQHPDTVPGSHEAKRLIRGWIQSEVAKLPIQNTATTPTYSDIGYIVLGWWFESRFKQSLDELIKSRVLTPWHLTSTRFVGTNEWTSGDSPLANFSAATELCPIRKRVIVGQVHDENAFALGGVCGHAGLFSTADDVGKWADHLLNSYYGFGPVKQETVKLFWTTGGRFSQNDTRGHFGNKISPADLGTWRLGWDTPSVTGSSGGNNIPRDAVGHLGFTGCSVWIVPSLCATVVLLSNRVHPTRNNDAIKTFRPALHNLIWDIVRQTTPQQNKFSSS